MSLIFDPPIDPADLPGKRVTIVSLGKGRTAAGLARWLIDRGADVTITDRKPREQLAEGLARLAEMGVRAELVLGPSSDDIALADPDLVFVGPGIRPRSATILRARERGIPILTEIGLFFRLCPAPIVGITGTKGKSTTTTLIGRILSRRSGSPPPLAAGASRRSGSPPPLAAGASRRSGSPPPLAAGAPASNIKGRVLVGGNIGRSVIEELPGLTKDDIVVLELSSFQLETLGRSPHVAVVTNVLEDHLDHHGTRDAYVAAKSNVVRWQGTHDIAVLNLDDATAMAMHDGAGSQLRPFSLALRPRHGAYLDGRERLVLTDGARETVLCAASELRVPGRHNVANALAAAIVGSIFDVPPTAIADELRAFEGLPHRLETVAEQGGVLWVNDSQGTTPYATIAALSTYGRPPVVILGGVSKDADFTALGREVVARARGAVLIGQAADEIAAAIAAAARRSAGAAAPRGSGGAAAPKGSGEAAAEKREPGPEVVRAADLREAVERAREIARPGDVVLLSPACQSFDMFSSYEERGDRFRDLVREMAAAPEGTGAAGAEKNRPAGAAP